MSNFADEKQLQNSAFYGIVRKVINLYFSKVKNLVKPEIYLIKNFLYIKIKMKIFKL